jgi:hypothetical protein
MGNVVATTQETSRDFRRADRVPRTGPHLQQLHAQFRPRPGLALSSRRASASTSMAADAGAAGRRARAPRFAFGLPGSAHLPLRVQAWSNLLDHGMTLQQASRPRASGHGQRAGARARRAERSRPRSRRVTRECACAPSAADQRHRLRYGRDDDRRRLLARDGRWWRSAAGCARGCALRVPEDAVDHEQTRNIRAAPTHAPPPRSARSRRA